MRRFVYRLWQSIQYWRKIDGCFIAAAVSFYAGLAAFPLIFVLMSVFGWFLAKSTYVQNWETRLIDFVANESSRRLADQLAGQFSQLQSGALVTGPLGFATFAVLSIALFVNLERAFDRIWKTTPEPGGIYANMKRILFHRLRAFLMLLGIILIVLLNFAANITIDVIANFVNGLVHTEHLWKFVRLGASVLLNATLISTVYQTIPKAKILWRHGIQGGLLTAVLWEIGRFMLSTLVISDRYSAFGVVGVFLALLLWLFFGMNVVLFGATFVHVTSENRRREKTTAGSVA